MFDHTHYVPILRWKPAEQTDLQKLRYEDRVKLTPLIELVPQDFKAKKGKAAPSIERVLDKKTKEINKCWGHSPLFVDLGLLNDSSMRSSHSTHPLQILSQESRSNQLSIIPGTWTLIPVTGLDRPIEYQLAVASVTKTARAGACFRLKLDDIQRSTFVRDLERLLLNLQLSPEQVDLLVDYQFIDGSFPSFANLCARLPHLSRWRTFTIASGAFPKDLSQWDKNIQVTSQRLDWLNWRNQTSSLLPRLPSYGDYTIQHGLFEEPPTGANPSASIRYAADEYWVIMRGGRSSQSARPRIRTVACQRTVTLRAK